MKHSAIDLEAGENAAAVGAINEATLWGSMKDIARTQGLDFLTRLVDENIETLEAGVHIELVNVLADISAQIESLENKQSSKRKQMQDNKVRLIAIKNNIHDLELAVLGD